MGPIGVQEMIAIFIVALILFGPKKLPELARTLGKALSEFRRAKNELKASFETHLHEIERETRVSQSPSSSTDYSSARYPHPYEDYSSPAPYEPEPHATEALPPPSAPAIQEPPNPPAELSSSQSAPVAGTVPRSNGIYS